MSTVLKFIEQITKSSEAAEKQDVVSDKIYIRKSSSLVTSALQKGLDVLQLSNGDVLITEVRIVTHRYCWNQDKKTFEREEKARRPRRRRKNSAATDDARLVEEENTVTA